MTSTRKVYLQLMIGHITTHSKQALDNKTVSAELATGSCNVLTETHSKQATENMTIAAEFATRGCLVLIETHSKQAQITRQSLLNLQEVAAGWVQV